MRAPGTAAPSRATQAAAWASGTCWSSGAAGGFLPVTSSQPTCSPLCTATTASAAAGAFSIRLLRGSRSPAIGSPRSAARHRKISRCPFAPPSSHSPTPAHSGQVKYLSHLGHSGRDSPRLITRSCGARLQYTTGRNRHGSEFDYYICNRRHRGQGCDLPYLAVSPAT